jgi:hypothetical protein
MGTKDVTDLIDRIVIWVAEWTKQLRNLYLNGRKVNKTWTVLSELEQVLPQIDRVCDWLERNQPELFGPLQRKSEAVKALMKEAKRAVCTAQDVPPSLTTFQANYDKTALPLISDLNNDFVHLAELLKNTARDLATAKIKKPKTSARGGETEDIKNQKSAETEGNAKSIVAAIVISFVMILLFELSVYFGLVTWVKNHPRSYGIQGSVICLIPCLIFGFLKPRWRKWCWGTAAIAFLVGLLSLL